MTSPRTYHSPLRSERANQTRTTILRAARRLFENKGLSATTIKDIAEEADVSVPTVYATFGSKAGLVIGLLGLLEDDAGDLEKPEDPDADTALDNWLDTHTRIFEQGRPLLRIVTQALGEPGVAQLVAQGDSHRRQALERIVTLFTTSDGVQAAGGTNVTVDQMWVLSSVGVYLDLIDRCGWSTAQYRTWLDERIRRLLAEV